METITSLFHILTKTNQYINFEQQKTPCRCETKEELLLNANKTLFFDRKGHPPPLSQVNVYVQHINK